MSEDTSVSTAKKVKKPYWVALESNPEAFNQYLTKLGIGSVECSEVFGFDAESLEYIPGPHYAMIFCFPCSEKAENHMRSIYADLEAKGQDKIQDDIFFMNQKIGNACGTFSLLHAITNNLDHIETGNGPFARWYQLAKPLGVHEHSHCLAGCEDMANAHQECAERGETHATLDTKVEHHFISYLNHKGQLYEFDSEQNFPRVCGPTTNETLLVGDHPISTPSSSTPPSSTPPITTPTQFDPCPFRPRPVSTPFFYFNTKDCKYF